MFADAVKMSEMQGEPLFVPVLNEDGSGTIKGYALASLPIGGDDDAGVQITGGLTTVASATFNRPADTTAYSIGDLIANSTVAGSVVPLSFTAARKVGGTGQIRRARISTNKTGMAGTEQLRLHLFRLTPTTAVGDNAAMSAQVNGVAAVHMGQIDVTLDRLFSDGSKGIGVPAAGAEASFNTAADSQIIFGLLEARTAFTPSSGQTFTVELEILRD